MVYFIRARTHFNYAQRLLNEVVEGKRSWSVNTARDIFKQAVKAIYSLIEVNPPKEELSLDEVLKRILPTLSEDEREIVLKIKERVFSASSATDITPADMSRLLEIVKQCLGPIL